jgi:hypothetical protein
MRWLFSYNNIKEPILITHESAHYSPCVTAAKGYQFLMHPVKVTPGNFENIQVSPIFSPR